MILLDTDIMVDLLRGYPAAVEWLRSLGDEEVCLPGYVVMELLEGAPDKAAMDSLRRALEPYLVRWPDEEACGRALAVYAEARLSHGLSAFDALIGETAKALGLPLHTFNEKHYSAIPGLATFAPYPRSAGQG